MLAACRAALPVEVAICAAAVADWRVAAAAQHKLKKDNGLPPSLELAQNPDILAELSQAGSQRPSLVVGFAAETEKVVEHARLKLDRQGCDWILANDVAPGTATFGGDRNRIQLRSEEPTSEQRKGAVEGKREYERANIGSRR